MRAESTLVLMFARSAAASTFHFFIHLIHIYRMPTVCLTMDTSHYGEKTSLPHGVHSLVAVGEAGFNQINTPEAFHYKR